MAEQTQDEQAPAKGGEVSYPRARVLEEAQEITGYPRHVVAGALADLKGKGDLTAKQAQDACEKHLNRVVKEA